MNYEIKNYLFILLTNLARGMIEVFIPIFLFKTGFTINQIFIYILFVLIISILITYPFIWLGNKFKYKYLIFLSLVFLFILYFYLLFITNNLISLFFLALFYALYRRSYWSGRRYFSLKIIPLKNINSKVGNITIISEIANMISTYLGALILTYTNNIILFITSIVIFLIGVIFISNIPEENNNKIIISSKKIIQKMPLSNIIFLIFNEAVYIFIIISFIFIYLY